MRPRVGDCSTSAATSSKRSTPGRICCNQAAHPSPNRYMAFRPCVVQFAQFSLLFLHTACRLRAGRPDWFVARTFTCPGSAMRRIVQSPTEGSTNESNHGRLVVTPATRLGEVQPAAPAFQAAPAPAPGVRPCVRGKFLFVGDEKLYVRGVTYGAFTPDAAGNEYHDLATVERDFAQMAANGINAVRIPHTTPPRALLDIASRHGLRVMVGLSAEQYVGYLIDRPPDAPDIEALIRNRVRACAGHPALLCYALGNEIPALVARWLGRRKVERYLERLYRIVKQEDPEGLVTYVNYPTTEYLRLPFLDFLCFNVYLESQDRFEAYLGRLQNIAGDRRVVPPRPRRRGLGVRSDPRRSLAQARARDRAGSVRRSAVRAEPAVAPGLGGGVLSQRGADDPRFLGRAAPARVPQLRSHRRGRRLDRRHRRDRGPVRRSADPEHESRPVQRAEYRSRSGHRGDRRLPGRRRLSRSALADVPRGHVPEHVPSRCRWAEYRSRGRWADCGVRRPRTGGTRACAGHRSRGRAHPRLQHGVPHSLPRGGRWVRSQVPNGRRRRRRVLEAAGSRLDARLPPGRRGVAPPSQFGAHLLAATNRLWPRRGNAGAQMAGEVQRRWARPLDGPDVRQRTALHPGVAARPRVSRRLRRGAVPVPVRARPHALGVPAPDARVAPDDRDAGRDRRAGRRVESAAARTPAARGRDSATDRSGVSWGRPGAVPRRSPGDGAAGAPRSDRGAALASAHRAAAWAHSRRPHPVAAAVPAAAGATLARHRRGVE